MGHGEVAPVGCADRIEDAAAIHQHQQSGCRLEDDRLVRRPGTGAGGQLEGRPDPRYRRCRTGSQWHGLRSHDGLIGGRAGHRDARLGAGQQHTDVAIRTHSETDAGVIVLQDRLIGEAVQGVPVGAVLAHADAVTVPPPGQVHLPGLGGGLRGGARRSGSGQCHC